MKLQIRNDPAAWLHGSAVKCSAAQEILDRPWRIVLLGAPGVGKGTQAQRISERLKGCRLSTGDIFRAAEQPSSPPATPNMAEALTQMRHGELVLDSTVWQIVRERGGCIRCGSGFVLDGFPRTLSQARSFQQFLEEEGITLDAVLNYELPTSVILSRLGGRRVCKNCNAIFHETNSPPRSPGICDKCASPLIQRVDDRPESIMIRLEAYKTDTQPIIDFYRNLNLLVPIHAIGTPDEIFARSVATLETAMIDGPLRSRNPHDSFGGLTLHHNDAKSHLEPL